MRNSLKPTTTLANQFIGEVIKLESTSQGQEPSKAQIQMPDTIKGYTVIGKLVIDKIKFDQYIINTTTENSLNVAITRFYGPKANQKGNLCITGHNTKPFFHNLNKMAVNDTFYIIDKENSEKVTYRIYDKYTSSPYKLDCLNQDTNEKREVTLITCNPRRIN